MTPALVVFVDAYPFDLWRTSCLATSFESIAAVRPGLGYSVNCQAELFSGKLPDALGYWCDHAFDPKGSPFRRLSAVLPMLGIAERSYVTDRLVRKIFDRVAPFSVKSIPFSYLQYFVKWSLNPLAAPGVRGCVLDARGFRRLSYLNVRARNPEATDAAILELASEHVLARREEPLFVALGALDNVGHWAGVGAAKYERVRSWTDHGTLGLFKQFREQNPTGPFVLLSDHGMSNVTRCIAPAMEARHGPVSLERYVYFVEGTILRVWVQSEELRREILDDLGSRPGVQLICDEERKSLGLLNPEFGGIIAVAEEGAMWVPSFWGPKPSVGMHGYHPRYDSQRGIFASDRPMALPGELSSIEVAGQLRRLLLSWAPEAQSGTESA